MSILPNLTYSAPGVPLYGAGGGNVGNTLTLSTLTFGVGSDANQNNIVTQTGILQIAGLGDTNNIQIGGLGSDLIIGNQYGLLFQGSNNSQGDITFGDVLGFNSGLVAINYQSVGLASSNVSTLIYGNASVELLEGGTKGGLLKCYDLSVSTVNGAAPALTSYSQQDVGALFSTLFAANPSLSTITY